MKHFFMLVAVLIFASCATYPAVKAPRSSQWATAITMEGVPNLHQVDAQLYRSGQPTAAGMKQLQAAGIKTVINLRYYNDDTEEIAGTQMKRIDLATPTWKPNKNDANEFLRVISQSENGPFLVHCHHGSDRTGAFCAYYRIHKQHWSAEAAIDEMLHGGYGFHRIWKNLPTWVKQHVE